MNRRIVAGFALASAVSYAAFRARALSGGGAIAATAVGTATFARGGWPATAVLFAFFLPATVLSRAARARKRGLTGVAKTGPRDARQVGANGAVAAAAIAASSRYPAAAAAFAGALAAAAADTWATEVGTLAAAPPRSLLTGRLMEPGLSGGITWQGSIASAAGAAVVAGVARATRVAPFWPVAAAGIAGSLFDSLLGGSAQALRRCPACQRDCETNPHACGTPTVLRRGVAWLENDAVNLAATTAGALAALAGVLLL